MIVNDLMRLRWQILDEALRDQDTEYFMDSATKDNETGRTRSLLDHVNRRLKAVNKEYKCSKRMLQNDVTFFQKKGARLHQSYRRGHKRILRYINPEWKNPCLSMGQVPQPTVDTQLVEQLQARIQELEATIVTLRSQLDEANQQIAVLRTPKAQQRPKKKVEQLDMFSDLFGE